MYEYRNLCEREQFELVLRRISSGHPWHSPPHSEGTGVFLLTAACYEHANHIADEGRRASFCDDLHAALADANGKTFAWVVLPNHYHVLWSGNLDAVRPKIARLHNGTATRWNREDRRPRRQVWYQMSDRRMRGERHLYATINYIHGNPVKHGWAQKAGDWAHSSFAGWLERHGADPLRALWRKYPPGDYGKGWDD